MVQTREQLRRFWRLVKQMAKLSVLGTKVLGLSDEKYEGTDLNDAVADHISQLYCSYKPPGGNSVLKGYAYQPLPPGAGVNAGHFACAMNRLAKHKAIGVDGLPDNALKEVAAIKQGVYHYPGLEYLH